METRRTEAKINKQYVVASIENRKFGLPLEGTVRILRIAEITPLPDMPAGILGIVNVRGEVVSVVDIRSKLKIPQKGIDLSDRLVILRNSGTTFAIIVDHVLDLLESGEEERVERTRIAPLLKHTSKVMKTKEGMIPVIDVDSISALRFVDKKQVTVKEYKRLA